MEVLGGYGKRGGLVVVDMVAMNVVAVNVVAVDVDLGMEWTRT